MCALLLDDRQGLDACPRTAPRRARRSIAKYNVVSKPPWHDLQGHLFDGDSGVTVCTYPNGRLAKGMMYDTLVSTGFTSPVIAGLLLDRNLEDVSTDRFERRDNRESGACCPDEPRHWP